MSSQKRDDFSEATSIMRVHDVDFFPQLEVAGDTSDDDRDGGREVEFAQEEGVVDVAENFQPDRIG